MADELMSRPINGGDFAENNSNAKMTPLFLSYAFNLPAGPGAAFCAVWSRRANYLNRTNLKQSKALQGNTHVLH
jgi:hypothetical protein